jgi:hypothetical protein
MNVYNGLQLIEEACKNNSGLNTELAEGDQHILYHDSECTLAVQRDSGSIEVYSWTGKAETRSRLYHGLTDITNMPNMPETLRRALTDPELVIRSLESKFSNHRTGTANIGQMRLPKE